MHPGSWQYLIAGCWRARQCTVAFPSSLASHMLRHPLARRGGGLYLYSLFMHTLSTVIAKLFSPGSVTYQYLYRASN